MDILKELDLSHVVGGGYWWRAPNGQWFYIDNDEEPDGDDIIWNSHKNKRIISRRYYLQTSLFKGVPSKKHDSLPR